MYSVKWSYEKGMKKSLVRLSGLFAEKGLLFRGLSAAPALDRRHVHVPSLRSLNYVPIRFSKFISVGYESRMGLFLSRQSCHATSSQQQERADAGSEPARKGKRKVALFIGYEGTNYRGLQIQPKTTGSADSIEYTLEEAIYQSGGILESNRGCLKKIGWARSSRTDKRVHSLCTVISLKLECDSGIFEEEPDGRSIAESINGHLPPEIRVFAVQRVVKSFDARRDCARRQYDYYLPLSFLMRANENRLSKQEIIERLREAWGMYEGYNAFHNFTKRRLYRYRTKMNEKGDNDKIMSASSSELESETESRIDLKSDFSVEEKSEEEDTHGNGTKGKIHIVWKDQKDDADPVTKRHFRLVEDCICSESPLLLTEDGIECLKLSITGQSFMLHQIRHMVGGAVLVALGKLPLDVLKAALTPPARINLPLAPPGTLLLRNAQFMKFRSSWDGRPSVTQKCSGEKLSLLSNGIEKQDRFAKDFLFPAINEQFSNDDWERWLDTIGFAYYDADAGSMIAERSQEWAAQRESRKLKREQAILEESEI